MIFDNLKNHKYIRRCASLLKVELNSTAHPQIPVNDTSGILSEIHILKVNLADTQGNYPEYSGNPKQ